MDVKTLRRHVQKIVQDMPAISLAYLFGSRVEGKTGPLSDYDFAILTDHSVSGEAFRFSFQHAIEAILNTNRVDVVLLRQAPIELAYAVIAQGVLLYERAVVDRVEYEAFVMGRYGDYLPVLRQQRRDILQGDTHVARVQRYRTAFGRTERTLSQIAAAANEIVS